MLRPRLATFFAACSTFYAFWVSFGFADGIRYFANRNIDHQFGQLVRVAGTLRHEHSMHQASGSSRTEEELFSRYGFIFPRMAAEHGEKPRVQKADLSYRVMTREPLYGCGRREFLRRRRRNVCGRRRERLRRDYAGANAQGRANLTLIFRKGGR